MRSHARASQGPIKYQLRDQPGVDTASTRGLYGYKGSWPHQCRVEGVMTPCETANCSAHKKAALHFSCKAAQIRLWMMQIRYDLKWNISVDVVRT